MRGRFRDQGGLLSYISLEARVPPWHPLRHAIGAPIACVLTQPGPEAEMPSWTAQPITSASFPQTLSGTQGRGYAPNLRRP